MSGETIKLSRAERRKLPLHRFSVNFFIAALVFLFLVVGAHSGLLIYMQKYGWEPIIIVHVIVFYWVAVAGILTWFARRQIQTSYEKPMKLISEAAEKVAEGDFTVNIPYAHTKEKDFDLFDDTIRDLNTMIEELGSIETLKTDFISNVSHEMKTPLAVIKNYAELLEAPELSDADRAEYAQSIEDAAGRMTELITNILRLEDRAGDQTLRCVPPACRLPAAI